MHDHLAPGGRILVFFGTSGDIEYVRELSAGFAAETLASERLTRDGWDVDYFTFRLTPKPGSASRTNAPAC